MKDSNTLSGKGLKELGLHSFVDADQLKRVVGPVSDDAELVVIFYRHRYYRHLVVELVVANKTKSGSFKSSLKVLDPLDYIWKSKDQEEIKFYSAISRFKNNYETNVESDLNALKAILLNPLGLSFFVHDESKSSAPSGVSLIPIQMFNLKLNLELKVDESDETFQISGFLKIKEERFELSNLEFRLNYFVVVGDCFYLVENPYYLDAIHFLKQSKDQLILEKEIYHDFQIAILSRLETKIKITYTYLKRASKSQILEQGFDLDYEAILYLSESGDYVILTPVMKYGDLEVPVISQKQIISKDKRGHFFTLPRDEEKELQFITFISKMHPYFMEQLDDLKSQPHTDGFYIHRKHFLNPEWFLDAFEAWRSKGIVILGFNKLSGHNFSPFKAEIGINVISGIDWFETAIRVKFNNQTVSLKNLHKSIRQKSKFVPLDDGTRGLLPQEWLDRFAVYFDAGEIVEETLRTPSIKFETIAKIYNIEMLSQESRDRMFFYQQKLSNFSHIQQIEVPLGFFGTLRDYQREGLNWLNFLDDFNFGGCLADDMGLGKTIQILAFVLSQREKRGHQTNLLVVPASLIFNWEREIKKFAPDLKVLSVYGSERSKKGLNIGDFELVLISYGVLLSEIRNFKYFEFNYIFLDESQLIKNPDSLRYKAVRLLHSRNKVAITGTPIENNTFDLYGQFSFACPGLLGNREQFKQLFSVPIDQFHNKQRAKELHQLIHPFLLRRTKEQVARELPEKVETVIYCEMGEEQRHTYDSCRNEIRDYLMNRTEDEVSESSMYLLQGLTRLRQICNSTRLISDERDFGNYSAKLDVLLEQIELKSPYHKILVFSQFVGMLDLIRIQLENRQIDFCYLTGQTKNRKKVVDEFQNDFSKRVFLISLKAGGVGLNLTEADYVYLVDPWWNPAVENQAIDRCYRIGQRKNVMAIRLICPETIEEKIVLMQSSKKQLAKDLIKTDETIIKSFNKHQLLALL